MELKFNNIVRTGYLMKSDNVERFNYLIDNKIFIHQKGSFVHFMGNRGDIVINPNNYHTINIENLITRLNAEEYILNPKLQEEITSNFKLAISKYEKIRLKEIKEDLEYDLKYSTNSHIDIDYLDDKLITLSNTIKLESVNPYFEIKHPLAIKDIHKIIPEIISTNIQVILQYVTGETYIFKGENLFNSWLNLKVKLKLFLYIEKRRNKSASESKKETNLINDKDKLLKIFIDENAIGLFSYLYKQFEEEKYFNSYLNYIFIEFESEKLVYSNQQKYLQYINSLGNNLTQIFRRNNERPDREKIKQIRTYIELYKKEKNHNEV